MLAWSNACFPVEPFADVHLHFNWDQQEVIDAGRVAAKLEAAGIEFAVASGTPSTLALDLANAARGRVIPLFSPYIHELGRHDWYLDQDVIAQAEAGLASGDYHGIGEIHFMSGFQPGTDNRIFRALMALALSYRVPVLIHIDSANEATFLKVCTDYPSLDILFAHAGGNLGPRHIRRIVEVCANASIEFSARDPWRYGGLTDDEGRLLADWRALIIEHPDRFLTGTDPVWRVTRNQSWDLADDGWDYFEQLLDWQRSWIAQLPEEVRRKISVENARRLFIRK